MVVATKFNFPEDFFGANVRSTENLIFQKDLEGANVVVATKFNFPEGFFEQICKNCHKIKFFIRLLGG